MFRKLILAAIVALIPSLAPAQYLSYSGNLSCAGQSGETITASLPVINCAQIWNNAGVTFTGALVNVMDTASAAGSLLLDLQVAGVSRATIGKSGNINSIQASASGGGFFSVVTGEGFARTQVGADADSTLIALGSGGGARDVILRRDAANTLAQRNGTVAQLHRWYNSFTNTSNGEWGSAGWQTTANWFRIGTNANGTGTLRNMYFESAGIYGIGGTTSSFPALKRSSTVLQARLANDSAFAPLQGQLRTDTNYTAGATTPTGYLVLYDATGTAYRVPAEVAP